MLVQLSGDDVQASSEICMARSVSWRLLPFSLMELMVFLYSWEEERGLVDRRADTSAISCWVRPLLAVVWARPVREVTLSSERVLDSW